MFLIDYVIIFIIFVSVFFGLFRGFFKEIISSFFWFFNFYFFNKYYYFNSFYIDALQNIFLKNKISILVIFFFYKKMLNYISKKIIKKMNFSFFNIVLGGFFGIFRSMIIIFLLLFIFKYFSNIGYNNYIKSSIVMSVFFKITNYFFIYF